MYLFFGWKHEFFPLKKCSLIFSSIVSNYETLPYSSSWDPAFAFLLITLAFLFFVLFGVSVTNFVLLYLADKKGESDNTTTKSAMKTNEGTSSMTGSRGTAPGGIERRARPKSNANSWLPKFATLLLCFFALARGIFYVLTYTGTLLEYEYLNTVFSELPALMLLSLCSLICISWAEIYHYKIKRSYAGSGQFRKVKNQKLLCSKHFSSCW